jgi:hypothetical protein
MISATIQGRGKSFVSLKKEMAVALFSVWLVANRK